MFDTFYCLFTCDRDKRCRCIYNYSPNIKKYLEYLLNNPLVYAFTNNRVRLINGTELSMLVYLSLSSVKRVFNNILQQRRWDVNKNGLCACFAFLNV